MNTTEESSRYAGLLASFRETERACGGFEAWQHEQLCEHTAAKMLVRPRGIRRRRG